MNAGLVSTLQVLFALCHIVCACGSGACGWGLYRGFGRLDNCSSTLLGCLLGGEQLLVPGIQLCQPDLGLRQRLVPTLIMTEGMTWRFCTGAACCWHSQQEDALCRPHVPITEAARHAHEEHLRQDVAKLLGGCGHTFF
jgi:hypothetical protein